MPVVVGCTGRAGAGKTTLAKLLVERLLNENKQAVLLDGDELRETISAGLGFGPEDRSEHVRRISLLAKDWAEKGVVAVVATMSPFTLDRLKARETCPNFIDVWVDTPLEVCMARDPKGIYAKYRAGEIKVIVGVETPYGKTNPEVHLQGGSLEESWNKVSNLLKERL